MFVYCSNFNLCAIRFMFKDLIDLRNNNWISRQAELKATKLTRPVSTSSLQPQSSPVGGSQADYSFPSSPSKLGNRAASVGSQDVRQSAKASSAADDEWNTVTTSKKHNGKTTINVTLANKKGDKSVTPTNSLSASKSTSVLPNSSSKGGRFDLLGAASPVKGNTPTAAASKSSKQKSNTPKFGVQKNNGKKDASEGQVIANASNTTVPNLEQLIESSTLKKVLNKIYYFKM
jgi:hypothetical protein